MKNVQMKKLLAVVPRAALSCGSAIRVVADAYGSSTVCPVSSGTRIGESDSYRAGRAGCQGCIGAMVLTGDLGPHVRQEGSSGHSDTTDRHRSAVGGDVRQRERARRRRRTCWQVNAQWTVGSKLKSPLLVAGEMSGF